MACVRCRGGRASAGPLGHLLGLARQILLLLLEVLRFVKRGGRRLRRRRNRRGLCGGGRLRGGRGGEQRCERLERLLRPLARQRVECVVELRRDCVHVPGTGPHSLNGFRSPGTNRSSDVSPRTYKRGEPAEPESPDLPAASARAVSHCCSATRGPRASATALATSSFVGTCCAGGGGGFSPFLSFGGGGGGLTKGMKSTPPEQGERAPAWTERLGESSGRPWEGGGWTKTRTFLLAFYSCIAVLC